MSRAALILALTVSLAGFAVAAITLLAEAGTDL